MKVECILHREGGTKAEIGGVEYHFQPLPDGAHVADIENTDHVDRFLKIGEGYKLYHGTHQPTSTPVKIKPTVVNDPTDLRVAGMATVTAVTLMGSDVHEATYEIGNALYQLGDVVAMAHEKSGLTPDEWNSLEADDRHARIDVVLDDLATAAEQAQPPVAGSPEDERAALVEAYKAKYGKAPHYRLSLENLKAAVAAE